MFYYIFLYFYTSIKKLEHLKKNIVKQFLLVLLLAIYASAVYAQTPIIYTGTGSYTFDYSQVYFFEDSDRTFSVHSLQSAPFVPMNTVNQNFGFSKSAFWLQFIIHNNSEQEGHFFFKILYPLLNDIRLYKVQDGVLLDSIITGENHHFNTREIQDRNFIFKLQVNPGEKIVHYVRLCNIGETIRIPIDIQDAATQCDYGSKTTFYLSIFFGYILFAFVFNILLFFEFKFRHYFLLAGYILCMGIFLFIIDGYAFQFLWPSHPYIANNSMIFFSLCASIFILYFSHVFLKYPKRLVPILKLFYALAVGIIIWSLLSFPLNMYSFFAANLYVLLMVFGVLYVAFHKYLSLRTHSNLVFTISFVCIIFGVIIYILRNFGVLQISFITSNSLKIGFSLQITLLTVSSVMQFREVSRRTNKFLEDMVNKRTQIIAAQNEKLKNQNKQVAFQFKELEQSMKYAQRLQNAILPSKYKLLSLFKDHLILYMPQNIVSGDFYWISEKNSKTYIVTADCTGHGIPGGFLSMLGISFLNQIISKSIDISPNEIINKLRVLFSETMNNDAESQTRDSMDVTVCLFDHATKKMEYAGAFNSLLIFTDNSLLELSVDRVSLRKDSDEDQFEFTNYSVQLHEHDKFYLFTDGFIDQFGGELDKRFTKKRFKDLIASVATEPMIIQKHTLEKTFAEWKGPREQVDDILILGIEI